MAAESAEPELFDIAIVGGGMVGASLALALADSPWRVALIEPQAPDAQGHSSFDLRTTALGNASRKIFEQLGIWRQIQAHIAPIHHIHVSEAGRMAFARLNAKELGLPALGYVVPNRQLGQALWQRLANAPQVTTWIGAKVTAARFHCNPVQLELQGATVGQLRAKLVVAADGALSELRAASGIGIETVDYDQCAVVASLSTDRANDGTAYERFTSDGLMALLPTQTAAGAAWRTLIWAVPKDAAQELLQLDPAEFLRRWQRSFGWRAGRAVALGERQSYPLTMRQSQTLVHPRLVLIGNAAQAQHPVAGQGFNLALRDVAELVDALHGPTSLQGGGDPGAMQLLAGYAAAREADRRGVVRFTDALVRGFQDAHPAAAFARRAGLLCFDLLPPAKQALARVSLGFGQRSPRMARGASLSARVSTSGGASEMSPKK